MRYSLLVLSLAIVVASCQKGEQAKSKQEILQESKWKLNTAEVEYRLHNMGDMFNVDVYAKANLFDVDTVFYTDPTSANPLKYFLEKKIDLECADDDLFAFRELNQGAHIPGEKTCSINETAEVGFTWGITDGGTKMYIYDAKEFFRDDVNAELVEFYEDKFRIKYNIYDDSKINANGNPGFWSRDTTTIHMEFVRQ